MIVNVEFLDEHPLENVITSLNYKIDKTIFLGYESVVNERRASTEKFLKEICGVSEVDFCVVDDIDLAAVIDKISEKVNLETNVGNQVFFDLTGGESLLLVAFGILSNSLRAPMHMYRVETNEMFEYGYEDSELLSTVAECDPLTLNLDQYLLLYGGKINYLRQKEFKGIADGEDTSDVEKMWKLYEEFQDKWVYYCGVFRRYPPTYGLTINVDGSEFQKEFRKNGVNGKLEDFHDFLDKCQQLGFLKSVVHNRGCYQFTYKNQEIKDYFWDGGSVLEMYTYLVASKDTANNDCRIGVHIDWDGVIHEGSNDDVLNEIDILSISNNLPTFISCKIGKADQTALYELDAVASRFGGKYAKKVLAVAKPISTSHLLRAEEMGIEVRNML